MNELEDKTSEDLLAKNYQDHEDLLSAKKTYYNEPAQIGAYKREADDPRLVALYLPQFHPIPENDAAWGKDFTEWTNVRKAIPRFAGHLQPIAPGDLGYYDLRDEQVLLAQINLAKQHGLYGFCFYYYWFSGKKLLDVPINTFLKHKEWDFNFAICWANENWTKRWDGLDNEVIIAQQYLKDDPLRFIQDVEDILLDPRYITVDGKPLLMVYRTSELKVPHKYAETWRSYFKEKHNKELYLVSVLSFDEKDPRSYGFDAALDFVPLSIAFKQAYFHPDRPLAASVSHKLLDPKFSGSVLDYREVALNTVQFEKYSFPHFTTVMPSWDNDARKKGKSSPYYNSNPDLYGNWLRSAIEFESVKYKSPLVFLNAWNEWGEGAILEPTEQYGHAVLNHTTQILSLFSADPRNRSQFPLYGITKTQSTTLGVIVHLDSKEGWQFVNNTIKELKDLKATFIILVPEDKPDILTYVQSESPNSLVVPVPKWGGLILPFLHYARRLEETGHTKLLRLNVYGTQTTESSPQQVIDKLIQNKRSADEIISFLESHKTIIGATGDHNSLVQSKSDESRLHALLKILYGDSVAQGVIKYRNTFEYFSHHMFWASTAALSPLLQRFVMPEDFNFRKGVISKQEKESYEIVTQLLPQVNGENLYEIGTYGIKAVKV